MSSSTTLLDVIHHHVLQTHILTRLDGPTLASLSCASSQLHALCTHNSLWKDICKTTWPSIDNPRMRHLISTFPDGPRSFFSDAFSLHEFQPNSPPLQNPTTNSLTSPPELISAVDLHYRGNLIFSKYQETETLSDWFRCSPFRFDLLEEKEVAPVQIKPGEDTCRDLKEGLKLSWIVIDPIGRRVMNLSSCVPVSVKKHWLTKEILVKFVRILTVDQGSSEYVQCEIDVSFGMSEGGEMQVIELCLQVEDMDGFDMNGIESLVILQKAMVSGKGRKGKRENGREKYEEFLKMRRERIEKKLRKERRLEKICLAFPVFILVSFCLFVLFN